MIIDAHCHLDFFENYSKTINDSKEVKMITCGINKKSNRKTLKIKEENPKIEICLGIYPSDCLKLFDNEIDSEIQFIKKNKSKIIAIGEVGLDLKEADKNSLDNQKRNLLKFINLAKELGKPIIIHSRKAEAEAIDFLEKQNYKKIIMHCFSGKLSLIKRIIENNWILTIPTNVKHSTHFQKVIEIVPIKNLLCETDSPFLHPDKKFPNEPKNVIESYRKIAEIKKMNIKEVEKQLEENYKNLFKNK